MNLHTLMFTGLLASGFVAPMVDAATQTAQPVPSGIVLNGIAATLGDKRAFFRVSFTAGAREANFMLAEGQSRYGIRLLAVNPQLSTVTVSHEGLTQTISICSTPTLLSTPASDIASAPPGNNDVPGVNSGGNALASSDEVQAADPPHFAHPVHAAGWGGGQNGSSGGAANNAASGDNGSDNGSVGSSSGGNGSVGSSFGANGSQEHLYQWWVQEAQKIEQARIETAQRVLAGEWQPYPLTPLTPPSTSPQLIGPDSVFMEHGPGMMISSK